MEKELARPVSTSAAPRRRGTVARPPGRENRGARTWPKPSRASPAVASSLEHLFSNVACTQRTANAGNALSLPDRFRTALPNAKLMYAASKKTQLRLQRRESPAALGPCQEHGLSPRRKRRGHYRCSNKRREMEAPTRLETSSRLKVNESEKSTVAPGASQSTTL